MKSIIIFLIWLALAVIGILAKAGKKSQDQGNTPPLGQPRMGPNGTVMTPEQAREQQLKEMWERQRKMAQKQSGEQSTETEPEPKPVVEDKPLAEEGIAATEPIKTTPQPAPAPKSREMDFDPVEMVIYSEVMEPGYEKY